MNPEEQPQEDKIQVTNPDLDVEEISKESEGNYISFPVAGIGASAGGIEAFIQFLSHLPINTGIAFVLVQHLDPDRESLLAEILGRATDMPVIQVEDGMVVEPNHVYVIPAGVTMTIGQGGILKLYDIYLGRRPFMTVNTFFQSLAKACNNKAIGIVMSGGDSDGTQGLEEIKAVGGITFAQSESTAKVPSMPHMAAATGQVDFVLTPQKIAEELANISHHPYITSAEPVNLIKDQTEGEVLAAIFRLVKTATGLDFTYYKQTTLKRRTWRRMALYKMSDIRQFAQYLQEHPTAVMDLYDDILINVTSFFRDPEAFESLQSHVFPTIVKDKSASSPVRIWVAGCSTGEEAYSIAIALMEFLAKQGISPAIQIYATDISEKCIEKARSGIYTSSQLADVSREQLRRFFVQIDSDTYQICKNVREQCIFARQNLINDPPFSRLDLISCRNVLIYLDTPLQKKLLPIFHYGLKPSGFLMLGISETVGDFLDLFALVDKKNKIYSRKLTAAQLNIALTASSYALDVAASPQIFNNQESQIDLSINREVDRIILQQYAPVGVIINAELEILQFRGQTSAYLEPAPGRASLNLLKMAKLGLRLELRTALHHAKKQDIQIRKEGIEFIDGDLVRYLTLNVVPFKVANIVESYFLVLFEETAKTATPVNTIDINPQNEEEILRMQQELASTKEHLQAIIEEQQSTNQDLRAANEEILSSNEELQSTNEELETAKEEIQATNEELNTINEELHCRNIESTQISNDLQNLLSSINIPILMLEGDLRIRRFTPAAQRILNLIPTDVGRPFGDINHNLKISDLEEQIAEVINALSIKEQEVQTQDGHWYHLRIRPYRTSDNRIDGAVVILVDINALKHSTQQLRESHNYAEAIVETIREPLVVLNSDLCVLSANRAFYKTFQVTPSETIQRLIFDLGNGQWNSPQLRSLLEKVRSSSVEQDWQDLEIEHDFEQIGPKLMLLNAHKMVATDHQQEMILLAIEDISEQKRLQIRLKELLAQEQSARTTAESANLAKDEFLSTLSHELRNPLNSLLGWAHLLRTSNLDAQTIAMGLEAIECSAKLQTQLVEDLLDISRITSGKLRLNLSLMRLASIIRTTIEVIQPSAEAKQIQIEHDLAAEFAPIAVDASRLQQVVWNLLSNAIKFTSTGGHITVRLDYFDTYAQIQIKDTGQGINPRFIPYIFDRFRQADSSQTRVNSGLGLGLSIAKQLVEMHGGSIYVESPGEGQGSTFTFHLPLRTSLDSANVDITPNADRPDLETSNSSEENLLPTAEEKPFTDDGLSLTGIEVLVVEDSLDNRDLTISILNQYEAAALGAASAQEALALLAAYPGRFDVILSDINMPEEDGYSFIRQVRSLQGDAGNQIPAIAITANARDEDREAAIAAGFQMYFRKPINWREVTNAIKQLTGSAI